MGSNLFILSRFTKDLKPADISLSFLSGKGVLRNLELDADFITEVLQLPPWLCVSRVVCDTIRAQVPFTSLRNDPLHIVSCVLCLYNNSTPLFQKDPKSVLNSRMS